MPRVKPYIVGALFGASLSFVACRYHVVRYADGVMLVNRTPQPPIRSAYVDIRDWGTSMWKQYPEVAAALTAGGHSQLVAEQMVRGLKLDLAEDEEEFADARKAGTSTGTRASSGDPLTPIKFRDAEDSEPIVKPLKRVTREPLRTEDAPSARKVEQTVQSALESLFAPYAGGDSAAAKDAAGQNAAAQEVSVQKPAGPAADTAATPLNAQPVSTSGGQSDSAGRPVMEIQSLEIELGEPLPLRPDTIAPRAAGLADPPLRLRLAPNPARRVGGADSEGLTLQ
ncbi:MAG: hypothetical protein KF774_11135 [Planctomyces sp.]|nr:hypothetical protein [Planctomyces sp.]